MHQSDLGSKGKQPVEQVGASREGGKRWDLHDGETEAGPADEQQVLALIADGLPESTMIRRTGEAEWRSLRTHVPFAIALERMRVASAEAQVGSAVPAAPVTRFVSPRVIALSVLGVCIVGLVLVAKAALAPPKILTSKDIPPAPAPAPTPPQRVEPNPLDTIMAKKTASEALDFARPFMVDKPNESSRGTYLFALWSLEGLRWQDVGVGGDQTSFALVQKDADSERRKRLCVPGTIIEIAASKQPQGTLYVGLLISEAMNIYHFLAVRSTEDLVQRSAARFCGFVTGKYDYSNSAGGTGHAVEMVGMFDLASNKRAK